MPSQNQPGPNFFIAGAPKAGTTSLYHWLAAHPQIYMSPVKEPSYFSFEVRPENFLPEYREDIRRSMVNVQRLLGGNSWPNEFGGVVGRWEDYLQLFDGVSEETAVGEGSVCYLWSKTAAKAIASCLPHARIILILRDPAERAFSQYLHCVALGVPVYSFREHVRASLDAGDQYSIYNPFLQMGLYSDQVQRYLEAFPREQIGIWLYEDTLAEPETFHRQVLEFLQVDAGFTPGPIKRHHEVEVPRMLVATQFLRRNGYWNRLRDLVPAPVRSRLRGAVYRHRRGVLLRPEDRRFLVEYYGDDVRRLERLIGRDLGTWLQ